MEGAFVLSRAACFKHSIFCSPEAEQVGLEMRLFLYLRLSLRSAEREGRATAEKTQTERSGMDPDYYLGDTERFSSLSFRLLIYLWDNV